MNDENNHDLQPDEAYDCGWGDRKETIIELLESEDFGGNYGERTSYEIVEFLREKV